MTTQLILDINKNCLDSSIEFIKIIRPKVWGIKLGMRIFHSLGVAGVNYIYENTAMPIFLDLKLYDIPSVVGKTVEQIKNCPAIAMTTLHISGGKQMLKEAAKVNDNPNLLLVGVTMLTSRESSLEKVLTLVDLAAESGISAVVCSGAECLEIKRRHKGMKTIVPGIRSSGAEQYDQKRTCSINEAVKNKADYAILGRTISEAENPIEAMRLAESELELALIGGYNE